jgi:hypothetical protein
MASRFFSIFRVPKHRQFNYEPRYYDPDKEEIRKFVELHRQQKANKEKETEVNIRYEFKSIRDRSFVAKDNKKRMLRLLVIFAVLVGMFYLLALWI